MRKDARGGGGLFGLRGLLLVATARRHFSAGHQSRQAVRKGPQLEKPERRSRIAREAQSGDHVVAELLHAPGFVFRVDFEHFGSRVFFEPRENDPGEIDLKLVLLLSLGRHPPKFVDYYVCSLPFRQTAVLVEAFVQVHVF